MQPGSKPYLLGTSALLTFIEDEDGAERVEELLRSQEVLLPFVVGVEVYYITSRGRSEEVADQRLALMIRQLQIRWLDRVAEPVLILAGRLKARYRISLADSLIAAFALNAGAILVHKDPEYEALVSIVTQEALPYKKS